jgi:uncharacterized protein (DUF2384 family)
MSVLQEVLTTGIVGNPDVAFALGTTPRSVERWRAAGADPARREMLDRLLELKAVVDLAAQVCEPNAASLWLRSPVPALGYDKPLVLVRDGEFNRIIGALEALAEGACS